MLERYVLGEAGIAYIRERLSAGKTLSSLLLQRLDLEKGHAWSWLPVGITDEQAMRFDDGGVTLLEMGERPQRFGRWEPVYNQSKPLLVSRIEAFLKQNERAYCLFEDPEASKSDPGIQVHPEMPLAFVHDEVYVLLNHRLATPSDIEFGISWMGAWWGYPAVLATVPAAAKLLIPRTEINHEQLGEIVNHVALLFFKAYDAEGFVLWEPENLPS